VKKTVALLTEQLRAYYTGDGKKTASQSASDLLPASPVDLLAQIVRGGGEIPEFVKRSRPRDRSVAMQLDRLEALKREQEKIPLPLPMDPALHGLASQAPYDVIKLAVEAKDRPARRIELNGWDPVSVLYGTLPAQDVSNSTPFDPLLLLSVLADLTGSSPTQDKRIASVFSAEAPIHDPLTAPLQQLLASHLKAREQARRLLEKMAQNAKAPELVNVVRAIDPGVNRPSPAGGGKAPKAQ
jgi:hypothetical protein